MDITSYKKSHSAQCLSAVLSLRKESQCDMLSPFKRVARSIKQIAALTAASAVLLIPYSYKTINHNFLQQTQIMALSRYARHNYPAVTENRILIDHGKYTITNLPGVRAGPNLTDVRWAGKVISDNFSNPLQAHMVTNIHATWTVAKVDSNSDGEVVQWGGAGGWLSNDSLIQAGTASNSNSSKAKYFAWFNIYPGYATISGTKQRIPDTMQEINGFAVKSGNKIVMDIKLIDDKKGVWELSLLNQTTKESLLLDFQYLTNMHTAEWILERPQNSASDQSLERLPKFTQANFGNASCSVDLNYAVINGKKGTITQFPYKNVLMVDPYPSGKVIARPSNLSDTGSCFSVEQISTGVIGSGF